MSERIAIIAALKREVAPFVRKCGFSRVEAHGFSRVKRTGEGDGASAPALTAYRFAETLLLASGIGKNAATRATRFAIEIHHPTLLISAGFAGALTPNLCVANVIAPAKIIDAATGRAFSTSLPTLERQGGEVLITATSVLSREAKAELAARFSAQAVDMEAAAVAEVAESAGIRFAAVKAISDPFDFDLPPFDRFIDSAGKLDLLKLVFYIAPRPGLWGVLAQLGRNTARAADALAGPLAELSARRPMLVK